MRNVVSAALLAVCVPWALHATGNDWPSRDGDPGGRRYSTLKQITPANVAQLTTAWTFEELKAKGFDKTGALNIGGSIVTAGGVIFIGATTDSRFRAFDESGKQLWETTLEASAHSIPMTFMGKDGRQYVVVAAGGGSFLASPSGTKIVAFALSNRTTPTR